ncbi:MAG: 50S ribosomal protein L29 [Candidatus Andersenbacteria bacterium CG10_big_fil_rev_8_21_14_0_10_54_11]|uniref:Large ribosomal subunit protein uL29 n=1 Tax=Candidatus Andersenbacteria bacterium CG10_big_fil_rev_8_21_14_0_10_54_11 TaxID=1974485 RepID=A0A2M6WYR9_9BACT|nr:MAG: 50S ribosomal protein L29 [Candidatus Andersenbacteria bacterium CG10_big_fil_rev_8_21_14_0_10_54_11]
MTTVELRELTPVQLQARLMDLRGELAAIRAAVLAGSEQNHSRIRQLRRESARTQTVLQSALQKNDT